MVGITATGAPDEWVVVYSRAGDADGAGKYVAESRFIVGRIDCTGLNENTSVKIDFLYSGRQICHI